MDGLSSENYKFADDRLCVLFSLLFNNMDVHGYVPSRLMDSIFKSHHSNDMCVFVLKETVVYYMFSYSPIYMCYVDASKAFDRVNYWHLFKLLSRGLPHIIVRLFAYWFTSQTFVVKWCDNYLNLLLVSMGYTWGEYSPLFILMFSLML